MPVPGRRFAAEAALVGAAFLFGSTFVLVQHAVEDVTPMAYLAARFTVGTLALAPFAWVVIRRSPGYPTRELVTCGAIAGLLLFGGYAFQTVGLQYTSASNSAFITGLYVPITPILEAVIRRQRPATPVIVGIGIATVGLFLLTGANLSLRRGDVLTLGCAVMFAAWLVYQNRFITRLRAVPFTTVQMAVLTLVALPATRITGVGEVTALAVFAILFTGVACSAVALSLQLYGQQQLGPSRTALILLLEPVFAGIVGFAAGDRLGAVGVLGALVILVGIGISELVPARSGVRETVDRLSG